MKKWPGRGVEEQWCGKNGKEQSIRKASGKPMPLHESRKASKAAQSFRQTAIAHEEMVKQRCGKAGMWKMKPQGRLRGRSGRLAKQNH